MREKIIKNRRLVSWLAAAALLIFFHWTGWLAPVENIFLKLVAPLAGGFYRLGASTGEAYDESTDRRDLVKLLKTKEEENRRLLKDNAELLMLREENSTLRDYHKFFNREQYNYVLANVVARDVVNQNPEARRRLIIDRGSRDGLREGLAAVDRWGTVIGRLTAVKDTMAEVAVVVDQECRLAVSLENETSVSGIAQGDAGLTIKINFIPQTKAVAPGNLVLTSGLEASVPAGLVVGRISQVNKESNELWQAAVVEPLADLDNLKILSVVVTPHQPFN